MHLYLNEATLTLLMVFLIMATSQDLKPGFEIRLSTSGLNYAADMAVGKLEARLINKPLPGKSTSTGGGSGKVVYSVEDIKIVSFRKPVSNVTINPGEGIKWSLSNAGAQLEGNWAYKGGSGKVVYSVEDIKIVSFRKPVSNVTINPGEGIKWSLTNAGAQLEGNWAYKGGRSWYTIRDSGRFDVQVQRLDLSVSIAMGVAEDGRPSISSVSCDCSITGLSLKLRGGASFLNGLFKSFLERPAISNLEQLLCVEARKGVDEDGNKELQKLNLTSIIDRVAILDYRLVAPPQFLPDFVAMKHRGMFYPVGQQTLTNEPVDLNINLPTAEDGSRMVGLYLSEQMLNSAASVLYQTNHLRYDLHRHQLKEDQKAILNMQCSGFICPSFIIPSAIRENYKNYSLSISLHVTDAAPTFTLKTQLITVAITLNATFEAHPFDETREKTPLFSVKVGASVNVNASMDEDRLLGRLFNFQPTVLGIKSSVGTISERNLLTAIKLAGKGVIKQLNEEVKMGIPLPTLKRVDLSRRLVTIMDGYIAVHADVDYKV